MQLAGDGVWGIVDKAAGRRPQTPDGSATITGRPPPGKSRRLVPYLHLTLRTIGGR